MVCDWCYVSKPYNKYAIAVKPFESLEDCYGVFWDVLKRISTQNVDQIV